MKDGLEEKMCNQGAWDDDDVASFNDPKTVPSF